MLLSNKKSSFSVKMSVVPNLPTFKFFKCKSWPTLMVQFASLAPHLVPKCPQKQQSRNFLANWQAFRKAHLHS